MADSVIVAAGSSDDWVALRIDLPVEIAEAVTSFLLDAGAPGVVTEDRDVDAQPGPVGRARLEAPVPAAEHPRVSAAVARYLESLGEIEPAAREAVVTTVVVPPVDWTAVARAHHRPLPVGRRLLVAPPWDVPAAPGREVLVIEPGMAFGTGQHATTRGCLEAIEAALEAGPVASALDVGTGSGVLALALARLGVPRVVALDVDPAVLPQARATLARNGADAVLLLAGTARAVRVRADLVVANLLADTIVTDAPALAAAVVPAGRLVLSGILVAQVPAVRAAFPGWALADTRAADGWETLTLVRVP
jgi:ribosomal protein L11 methyltransferase